MKRITLYILFFHASLTLSFSQNSDNSAHGSNGNVSRIYDVRPLKNSSNLERLTFPLNIYPTYYEYAKQMQNFESDYPSLVDMFSIGKTAEGDKEILFVKISDNISRDEQEPKLMLTSSMHGDEITGFPMMLTLIDYILKVYHNDKHPDYKRIKHLVDNTEIWINPNANPDGTYYGSRNNTSVANARRGNANNVDLNRNYPDNKHGAHPDDNTYQIETLHFIELAEKNQFVLSANLHGGEELINYPFDNTYADEYIHPDSNWFEQISTEYVNNAQSDASTEKEFYRNFKKKLSYMTSDEDFNVFPSIGVTHGAEWYIISGSRQDYMNYYHQCREITIELSNEKIVPESALIDYWLYNKNAILDFLTQGTYGFTGVVRDMNNEQPIKATITVLGHDKYGSNITSNLSRGDFYRPIAAGTYDLLFEAPNYKSIIIKNQSINSFERKELPTIYMSPIAPTLAETLSLESIVIPKITLN